MQKQQNNKVLVTITLAGLGVVAGVFGIVAWLAGAGGPKPVLQVSNPSASQTPTPVSAASGDSLGDIQNVPQGLFNYGGSTTWIPIHEPLNQAITAALPDFQLRYTLPSKGAAGSGTGVKMLLDSQLSFSESSRPLKPAEYEAAQQRGFTLEQIPAAIDGIALAVHPNLGMEGLSVDQITAIYTGAITNWAELGGPDLPVVPFSRSPEAAGTAKYFLDEVLEADTYGETVVFVDDTTTGIREVLKNQGGIYYASAPEVVNQCSIYAIPVAAQGQPDEFIPPFSGVWKTGQDCIDQANAVNRDAFREGTYPLTRRLFVIVKADGSRDEAAGRAYVDILLSPEGQTLIEQTGFVSIR